MYNFHKFKSKKGKIGKHKSFVGYNVAYKRSIFGGKQNVTFKYICTYSV